MQLHELLSAQAACRPTATALLWRNESTSYASLNNRVLELAHCLSGVGNKGDRIAVLAWNCPQYIELIYAAAASGRILVPLNCRLAPEEQAYQLATTTPAMLFADGDLLEKLTSHADFPADLPCIDIDRDYRDWIVASRRVSPPSTAPEDPVWILFTSGTTGHPKGAVLTHQSFAAGLESAAIGRPVQPADRYYYPFPLFHVAAHNVLLQHRYGAAVLLARSFDAGETLIACRDHGVTTLSLAPTMIAMLLEHPDFSTADLATARSIGYGASNMPRDLLRRLLSETDIDLCQSYGMTELSGSVSFLTPDDHRLAGSEKPELLASVGRPLPTAEIRLVDDAGRDCPIDHCGEILVRGSQCMIGYWHDEEATDHTLVDGWLHTGDIGRLDERGYLYIVDRKKDMIISGGENIASREVEDVLAQHPAVRDCAVLGLPDTRWGETVCAVVVLTRDTENEILERHCRRHLAGYKTPRRWIQLRELPVNAAGKIDKQALRRHINQLDRPATGSDSQ